MIVSIIILTHNRQKKLKQCIQSVLQNTYKNIEIVIIDQSYNKTLTKKTITLFNNAKINYYPQKCCNVSKGKNLGITKIHGDIIAFTDDDCIVHHLWIQEIVSFYKKNKEIDCMFGKTLPYNNKTHYNQFCPSTFTKKKYVEIHTPKIHWKSIGIGNNMSFRSTIFLNSSQFKEWLGYGTFGGPSEDAEITLRLLIQKHNLVYNPKAIVYHNNWLANTTKTKLQSNYFCANIVCYGYFSFQKYSFAYPVVKNEIKNYIFYTHNSTGFKKYIFVLLYIFPRTTIVICKLLFALYYSFFDPIK